MAGKQHGKQLKSDDEWLAGGQSGGNVPPDPGGRTYTPYGGKPRFIPWSEDLPEAGIELDSYPGKKI